MHCNSACSKSRGQLDSSAGVVHDQTTFFVIWDPLKRVSDSGLLHITLFHFSVAIRTILSATSLLCLQLNQNHFRAVIDPEWKDTVSDTSAHEYIGVFFGV